MTYSILDQGARQGKARWLSELFQGQRESRFRLFQPVCFIHDNHAGLS